MRSSNVLFPLAAGLIGAAAVNIIHESTRAATGGRNVPRLDVLGARALTRSLRGMGIDPPSGNRLYWSAMAGDLITNMAYYALVGRGRGALLRGGFLGALAGAGAILLPPVLGLGSDTTGRSAQVKLLAFVDYFAGGLIAGAIGQLAGRSSARAT